MNERDNSYAETAGCSNIAFYRNIMEQARDIILIVAADGKIIDANQAASNAYGYSVNELRRLRVHHLRSPETRAAIDAQLKMAQQAGILFRTVHLRRNGQPFPVEVSSRRVHFPDGEAVVSIIRDITETVAMEAALKKSEEKYRLLNEELTMLNEELTASEEELRQQFNELLVQGEVIRRQNSILASLHETALGLMQRLDPNDVLTAIISSATALIGTPHGYISMVNEEKGVFERKIGLGHYAEDIGRQIKVTEGIAGTVYKTGEICVVEDYSTWQQRLTGPFFDRLRAIAQLPLKMGGKVIGTFGVAFLTPERKFADFEIFLLKRFADLASIALVNAQLHFALIESEKKLQQNNEELTAAHEELLASDEELRQQFDELLSQEERIRHQNLVLTSLHETALALMHKRDLDDVLNMIVSSATKLLGTPDGFINLVDEAAGVFVRKVAVGKFVKDMDRQTKVTEGLLGRAYLTGRIAVVNDYSTWEHRLSASIFDGVHCAVIVPLKDGDRVVGAVGLGFSESGRTLADYEAFLLERFADLASIALNTATLIRSYQNELAERQKNELELKRSEASNQALISAIPDQMYIIERDGTFVDFKVHKDQAYMLPYRLVGKTVFDVFPEEIAVKIICNIEMALATADIQVFEYQLSICGKNEHYEARIVTSGEDKVLAIVRNITDKKRMEEQLQHLSLHDALTEVYNRAFFEEQMKGLQRLREGCAGLLICDVDGLKIVNDTLGHNMGDVVLKAVAQILKSCLRSGDLVARIGGDEFAVLLPTNSARDIEATCRRIRERIDRYNAHNPTVPISLSMGFAVSSHTPLDMAALFKEADNKMYREKLHRQKSARSAIVQALIKALEARDFITEGHGDRLQDLVESFASALGLPESSIADLRLLAHFHDIGKVGIPDSILFKPGRLTEEEWSVMRQHCEIGYRIAISAPDLAPIADWILKHQEWWNGKGYPLGLAGEEIPLECRILALADAYDAMTNDRPYRKAMSHSQAIEEIKKCAGKQFDPSLVNFFVDMLAGQSEHRCRN